MSAAENTQPQVITASPAITALPTGDEMVIDLPEGQKVLLGKLPPGTIIEIASWRGTGPPDHHTARILLSTSTGTPSDVASQPAPVAQTPIKPEKKKSRREQKKEAGPQHRKRAGAGQIVVIVLAVVAVIAVGTVLTLAVLNGALAGLER